MEVLVGLFVLFGIIFVIMISYYFYRSARQHTNKTPQWPPENYMRYVGQMCPDYWVYQGTDGRQFVCDNKYKIPIRNTKNPVCASNTTLQFEPIKDWPPKSGDVGLEQRCNWIKNCGPAANVPGSWVGIDKYC